MQNRYAYHVCECGSICLKANQIQVNKYDASYFESLWQGLFGFCWASSLEGKALLYTAKQLGWKMLKDLKSPRPNQWVAHLGYQCISNVDCTCMAQALKTSPSPEVSNENLGKAEMHIEAVGRCWVVPHLQSTRLIWGYIHGQAWTSGHNLDIDKQKIQHVSDAS